MNKQLDQIRMDWRRYKSNAENLRKQHIEKCVDRSIEDTKRDHKIKELKHRGNIGITR